MEYCVIFGIFRYLIFRSCGHAACSSWNQLLLHPDKFLGLESAVCYFGIFCNVNEYSLVILLRITFNSHWTPN